MILSRMSTDLISLLTTKMMGLSGDEKGGRAGIGGKHVGLEGMNIANMKTISAHDF